MDRVVDNSREMIRNGSKSFAAAARLFDVGTRESAYMLYAWCRYCDDVIDGQELGFVRYEEHGDDPERALALLRETTQRAMDVEPMVNPVFDGFQRVMLTHGIPKHHPLELIDGFEMDVRGRHYRTLEDTLDYCYHVAGVVGVMMAYVMGVTQERTLQRAADLGLAFQITNICRDVMDDAALGRVYLPEEWLDAAGVPPGKISDPRHREAVFSVVERLLDLADRYYASAKLGIRALPFRSAWAIATARRVYCDIGELVRQRGAEAWDQRAVVSKRRKVYFALRGALRATSVATLEHHLEPTPRDPGLWSVVDTPRWH